MNEDAARNVLMVNADAMRRGALSMWTIYDKPADHPDGHIARRFEVGGGDLLGPEPVPTNDTIKGELEAIRETFWKAGLLKLTRNDRDEPQIVETWI